MKLSAAPARFALVLVALLLLSGSEAYAAEDPPYLGSWSNGRGETLVLTEKTVRIGDGRALAYRDITRATDGASFELQITGRGAANGFGGNILGVVCDGDSMKITAYASHSEYMQGGEPQSVVTWFKDDEKAEEDE